jgi:hypothetical protein
MIAFTRKEEKERMRQRERERERERDGWRRKGMAARGKAGMSNRDSVKNMIDQAINCNKFS